MISEWSELGVNTTGFWVETDDLTRLEIRQGRGDSAFCYFYDPVSRRFIRDFILDDRSQVALICSVTLIRKEERYSPRIQLWRKDKLKPGREVLALPIPDMPETRPVKASVDTEGGHESFWKLIAYLQSLTDLDLPRNAFRVVYGDSAKLAEVLVHETKPVLLQAVRTALGGTLSNEDITILANRKAAVNKFGHLLDDQQFFDDELKRSGRTSEAFWQQFFEENSWIFGYGLSLVTYESLGDGKLERITTGANVFVGGGKRIDAIMKTRAVIGSLLFCEIKRHDTNLLDKVPYRRPDIFQPSKELTGGTAQLQKTVRKALRNMRGQIDRLTANDGSATGVDFSTTRPHQVLLIGNLKEFRGSHGANGEMMESFELYRKSLIDVNVMTYDELYERARFLVAE